MPIEIATPPVVSDTPPSSDSVVADAAQANEPGGGGLTVVPEIKPNPKSFEALRASRAERIAALPKNPAEVVANGAANNAGDKQIQVSQTGNNPPATAKVNVDADKLDAFVKLNTELREKDTRIKELETKAQAFERFQQYEALIKAGKHVEAARFIGFDMDKANLEILGGPNEPAVDPRVEALERELAALKANDQSRAAAEVSEAREAGKQATIEHVKANEAEFPLLSKSDRFVSAALRRAQDMHDQRVQEFKRQLTMPEKDALVLEALKAEEAERAEDAKVYGGSGGAPANDPQKGSSGSQSQGSTGQTITNANRGPVSNPGSTSKKKMSFEEVKRMRREAR